MADDTDQASTTSMPVISITNPVAPGQIFEAVVPATPAAPKKPPIFDRTQMALQIAVGIFAHQGLHTSVPSAVEKAVDAADQLIALLSESSS